MDNQENKPQNDANNAQSGQDENQNSTIPPVEENVASNATSDDKPADNGLQANSAASDGQNDSTQSNEVNKESLPQSGVDSSQPTLSPEIDTPGNDSAKVEENTPNVPNQAESVPEPTIEPIVESVNDEEIVTRETEVTRETPEQINIEPEQPIEELKPIEEPKEEYRPIQVEESKEGEKINFDTYTPEVDNGNNSGEKRYEDSDDEKKSRTGTVITAILIVIIAFGIWQTNKDDDKGNIAGTNEKNENITITVDGSEEDGTVTIVDDTKPVGDIKIAEIVENDENKVKIIAYYNKAGSECGNVAPLERMVEKKYESTIINTVRGLLTRLTADELSKGWTNNIPVGTYLKNVAIKDGVAKVILSANLDSVAGSCAVSAAKAQIEKTLTQFPYIVSVDICVEDNCNQDEILQP